MVAGNPFGKYAPQISPGRSKNVSSILTFTPPPQHQNKKQTKRPKKHILQISTLGMPLGGPDLNPARFVESWPRPWRSRGVTFGRNGFGSLLRSKSRASLIGSNHLGVGWWWVAAAKKKGKHHQKSKAPNSWETKDLKLQKKNRTTRMLAPGNWMKLLPGSHSHSPIAT